MLEKVSPDSMVYLGPQTPGAPSAAGVGVGAAPPTGVIAFGSRIAMSGGLSQGGAVGTVAGSDSCPISAFWSSPPPHAVTSANRTETREIATGRRPLNRLITSGASYRNGLGRASERVSRAAEEARAYWASSAC